MSVQMRVPSGSASMVTLVLGCSSTPALPRASWCSCRSRTAEAPSAPLQPALQGSLLLQSHRLSVGERSSTRPSLHSYLLRGAHTMQSVFHFGIEVDPFSYLFSVLCAQRRGRGRFHVDERRRFSLLSRRVLLLQLRSLSCLLLLGRTRMAITSTLSSQQRYYCTLSIPYVV